MVANSMAYRFTVSLPASAERAYRWAVDFRPNDPELAGWVGRRKVEWLTDDAVVLTDAVKDGRRTVVKARLVRLRPKERSWVNTHIGGPCLHSQFLYRIVPTGRARSRLEFTGLQIEYGRRALTAAQRRRRVDEIRRDDQETWRHLVRAMLRDLASGR